MKNFHRILVATDLTPGSKEVIDEAIEMAKGDSSELLIAYAYSPPEIVEAVGKKDYEKWDTNVRSAAEGKLQSLVNDARKEGVNATPVVLTGVPYEAISQAAKDKKADLLILGAHARKGVPRFFLGSVASRVIPTAPCPVLTVTHA
jgi:nucleotide-binding universal stress UspA family protein